MKLRPSRDFDRLAALRRDDRDRDPRLVDLPLLPALLELRSVCVC